MRVADDVGLAGSTQKSQASTGLPPLVVNTTQVTTAMAALRIRNTRRHFARWRASRWNIDVTPDA